MSERSLRRKSCLNALREHDQVENPSPAPLDLEPFIGTWEKTNEKPGQWIRRVEIAREGSDQIAVRLWGGDAPSPSDWGTAAANALFANAITSSTGAAFITRYDFGFLHSEIQGNVNLGLLVLAGFHRFRDGSGRSDLFTREFFRKAQA
jgi:hypothetical protein